MKVVSGNNLNPRAMRRLEYRLDRWQTDRRHSDLIDTKALLESPDPQASLRNQIEALQGRRQSAKTKKLIYAGLTAAAGLSTAGVAAWGLLGSGGGYSFIGTIGGALATMVLFGVTENYSVEASGAAKASQELTDIGQDISRIDQPPAVREGAMTPEQTQALFQHLEKTGYQWRVNDEDVDGLKGAQTYLQGGEVKFSSAQHTTPYPVRTSEDLDFLDFAAGADGRQLEDKNLAEACCRLAQDPHGPNWSGSKAHPLAIYNHAMGRGVERAPVQQYGLKVTPEGIKIKVFVTQNEELGLDDPELARGLNSLSRQGYEFGEIEDAYLAMSEGPYTFVEPGVGLQIPLVAEDVRDLRRAVAKAGEAERLHDTYLHQARERWGESFDSRDLLALVYQKNDSFDIKARTRTLCSILESELSTRLAPDQEHPPRMERVEQIYDLLSAHSQSDQELESHAASYGKLARQLPRRLALRGLRAAAQPVGQSTLPQRAEVFLNHMMEETFTVRRRGLAEDPQALERGYTRDYIDLISERFAPDDAGAVQERLRKELLDTSYDFEKDVEFEEDQFIVGDFNLAVHH